MHKYTTYRVESPKPAEPMPELPEEVVFPLADVMKAAVQSLWNNEDLRHLAGALKSVFLILGTCLTLVGLVFILVENPSPTSPFFLLYSLLLVFNLWHGLRWLYRLGDKELRKKR